MSMIFFTFRAQIKAKQAFIVLKKGGISGRIGKTPGVLAKNGCSYGIWVTEEDGRWAAEILRKGSISFERSYRVVNGVYQEVAL